MADFREENVTHAQTTLKVDGKEYNCKARNYGDSLEIGEVEGASQMATGRTPGLYKTDDSEVELYAEDFAELMEAFGPDFYKKTFEITNAYTKLGDSKLTVDTLVKCRFTKRSAGDQAGGDALTRTVGIKPLYIKWNGKNPLNPMPKGLQ